MEFPFRAEYAKSGRSNCRGCKSPIGQGTLRLAVMVQSPMFDGKTPNWYHFMCFFGKQRPKSEDDIEHFETLRIEDQNKIREKLSSNVGIIVPDAKGKGKKRDAAALAAKKAALKDFKIEYSKSSRATCRGCEQKIMKEEVRISKKDFESEVGMKYGGQDMWHHLSCFAKLRSELGYFESADKLPGFKLLKKDDQAEAKKELPPIKQEDIPDVKKTKTEDVPGLNEKEQKLYTSQNKIMYKYRDQLQENLSKNELHELLQYNHQGIPTGQDRVLDRLADIMTFGALLPCKVCRTGQFVFDKFGYKCHGNLTEWTTCNTFEKEPPRQPFKVPPELAKEYPFLKKYKYVTRTRVVKEAPPAAAVKKEENESDEPKVVRQAPPLYNMDFVILGQPKKPKEELKIQITKLGGKVITKISETVMAVIASKEDVEKMGARMQVVRDCNVQVVPEEFVDEAPKHVGKIPELIVEKSICDWGSDPKTRLPVEPSTSKSKSKSMYTKSMPSKIKLTVKDGAAVDPDSGLQDEAHVYTENSEKYTVVLGKTEIQTKKNSYYKLQLLQSNKSKNRFFVFRSWGRIGTSIGGNKLQDYDFLFEAKATFMGLYEEKTGNAWEDRHNFVKQPGLMYPIDIDYGDADNEQLKSLDITDEKSSLPQPVQDLIRLIFDVNAMQKVMLEFELDTEKMPLGKLSKKQIQSAYGVLTELQQLIDSNGPQARFVDATNRFYTFIPHSFGIDNPPVLNDPEAIKQKISMLDNLMELEIAYNLMKTGTDKSVDGYYSQLNTEIGVLEKDTEEYKVLQEYLKNTHAATHSSYSLEIIDVFTIKRQGEEKRFKPFKKLHNHKLLWHGSRTTNYSGILSQGLRIAPPEAPVTGYMFGKGIYFADMVSKSANYCCTTPSNSTGLLLLCDVALGNMYERSHAEYVEKLPKGKHSTKGIGRTEPNPEHAKTLNGIEVPLGTGVTNNKINSALLYNEYIVYDVAQVNVKYLLKVDFKYKY